MVSALSAEIRKSRICVSKPLLALFPVVFCELFRDVFCMVFTMRARIADNFSTILMQGGGQFVPPPDFRSTLSDFFENFSGCFSGNLSKKKPPSRTAIHYTLKHHTLYTTPLLYTSKTHRNRGCSQRRRNARWRDRGGRHRKRNHPGHAKYQGLHISPDTGG